MNKILKKPIYLDYMSTTPVDPRVIEVMQTCLLQEGTFGNPASTTHEYGEAAKIKVERARQQVADLIHAKPEEIIWTSGATESNNLALKGAANFYQLQGKHIITCKTEHKSVLDCCAQLEKEGFEVTYLTPKSNGLLDIEQIKQAIRHDTILVSIMHVNNEIGVIQDIKIISEITRQSGVLFHVDAAQSAGKIPIDVQDMQVDLMSFSGHKIYGPKGIGALYVRQKPRVRLTPQMHGGGHEQGLRAGTLATHQIVGMGEAFHIAHREMLDENKRILQLRDRLIDGLKILDDVCIHGDMHNRVAGNLNITFKYVHGDALLAGLNELAISTRSACTSASAEPSYVLNALNIPHKTAQDAVRISLGRFTTEKEIDETIEIIVNEVKRLRAISPIRMMKIQEKTE